MNRDKIRLIALDMDGTITQHRTPLEPVNRAVLDQLAEKYRLVMVGAGACRRIHGQLGGYPLDVIGNYGMEWGEYDRARGELAIVESQSVTVEPQEAVRRRVTQLRRQFGMETFAGDTVEFHASGMITFPLLGTKAAIEDKLAFDPDRSRRRPLYPVVREAFSQYTVFIGGSSSFDIVPKPFNKLYALERYCARHGVAHDQVVFFGDDYREGGNDQQVYESDFPFVTVDDYRDFPRRAQEVL
ncbi:MAG: HAD hydrolase family protein [Clostridia bacterium]|nr:HAD hydrolase family protein [Clostridia bacterium]